MSSNRFPFALSLSKGLSSSFAPQEGQGFDKLSPNGSVEVLN